MAETAEQLLAQRGIQVEDKAPDEKVQDMLHRTTSEPMEFTTSGCPPIRIMDEDTGETREYARRRPNLDQLEQLNAEHSRLMERIREGHVPAKPVLVSLFGYVMEADVAADLVRQEDFSTVLLVAQRVAELTRTE